MLNNIREKRINGLKNMGGLGVNRPGPTTTYDYDYYTNVLTKGTERFRGHGGGLK